MAYCNSGCSGGASSRSDGNTNYTRVGALGSLCRSGGCSSCGTCSGCGAYGGCGGCGCSVYGGCSGCGRCNGCAGGSSGYYRNPYYTGPCPPAPCNGCGCESAETTCGCTRNARVSEGDTCGCGRRKHHDHCTCAGNCGAGAALESVETACGCTRNARVSEGDTCGCGRRKHHDHCTCAGNCGAGAALESVETVCGCTRNARVSEGDTCGCTRNARVNEGDTCGCGRKRNHDHYACDCGAGTGENTCAEGCGHGCVHPDACYGVFAVNGPCTVRDGGVIVLTARDADMNYFSVHDGCIVIRRPGNYHVSLTVDIPTGMHIDTMLGMELDGRYLELPQLPVTSDSCASTHNYAAHTVFHANAGSVLRLTSLDGFACHHSTAHPIITLTLLRVT